MEAATRQLSELGLTTEELEIFKDGDDSDEAEATPLPRAAPPWPRWRSYFSSRCGPFLPPSKAYTRKS